MAEWVWSIGGPAPAGEPVRDLMAATGRTLTRRVDGPHTAQFSIDGRHPDAASIVERRTDLWVYRDGLLVHRGRIVVGSDDINAKGHRCQFTSLDYRGLLQHRLVGTAGRTFTAVDQAGIAWTLIDESQDLTGGDWGITSGLGATSGVPRDRTYAAGKSLLAAISELYRVDNGGEWEISPELELNRWHPRRGTTRDRVLDWGGSVVEVRRTVTADDWANFVISAGAPGTTPASAASATIGTDPEGRWELFDGDGSSIERQDALDDRAVFRLDEAGRAVPELGLRLASGVWQGTGWLDIGDTTPVAVDSGRVQIDDPMRVSELVVSLPTSDVERVTLGMTGAP